VIGGSFSVQVGSGTVENVVIGAAPASGAAADTFYTGSGVNTLDGLAGAINQNESTLGYYASVIVNSDGTTSLALESGTAGDAGTLTVNTEIPDSSGNVKPSLAAAGVGIAANVVTSSGQQTLSLSSTTAGSSGVLTVNSSIVATSDTPLTYSDVGGYSATIADSGSLSGIASAGDAISGSISIQLANGLATTISVPPNSATSPSNNLADLAGAINTANIGVTASVVLNLTTGLSSLQITSGTVGSAGALTVTSNILDTGKTNTATLSYTNSSDINSLSSLGITVNNDGSMALDATSLDSVLNSDYSSVVGFFQNVNSWGQTFSNMLTSSGTSSSTGILALASKSNSTIESTLNAEVAREDIYISSQQKSLTAELNSANEIMQALPSQLQGVNELYSAITGYNQNTNG
jgi:flagellar hook-associated protein 2